MDSSGRYCHLRAIGKIWFMIRLTVLSETEIPYIFWMCVSMSLMVIPWAYMDKSFLQCPGWSFFSIWGSKSPFWSREQTPPHPKNWYTVFGCHGLFLVVVFAVAKIVIQFRLQTILHELSNSLLEEVPHVIHVANVHHLQKFSDSLPTNTFFRGTILSSHMIIFLYDASILHHTGSLHKT